MVWQQLQIHISKYKSEMYFIYNWNGTCARWHNIFPDFQIIISKKDFVLYERSRDTTNEIILSLLLLLSLLCYKQMNLNIIKIQNIFSVQWRLLCRRYEHWFIYNCCNFIWLSPNIKLKFSKDKPKTNCIF